MDSGLGGKAAEYPYICRADLLAAISGFYDADTAPLADDGALARLRPRAEVLSTAPARGVDTVTTLEAFIVCYDQPDIRLRP